jgi:hypothetical protein
VVAFDHAREEGPDRQERGGQVAVDVGLPFLLGDVEDRLGPAATAGECGQHVDRAELLLDVDPHGLECGGVGAIGRGRHRVGAVGAELGDDRVDGGSVASVHRDLGMVGGERPAGGCAQSPGATGDDGDLAREVRVGRHPADIRGIPPREAGCHRSSSVPVVRWTP